MHLLKGIVTATVLLGLLGVPIVIGCGSEYITQKPSQIPAQEVSSQDVGNGVAGYWPATASEAKAREDQWFYVNTDQLPSVESARQDASKKLEKARGAALRAQTASTESVTGGDSESMLAESKARMAHTKVPKVVLPKHKGLGNPTGIYVLKAQGIERALLTGNAMNLVTARYSNGIKVAYCPDVPTKDYAQIVKSVNDQRSRDSGEHKSDLQLVSIHGHQGCGEEPGFDSYAALGDKHLRSAYLEWTDEDGAYTIRAPLLDQKISLAELIEIAESVY